MMCLSCMYTAGSPSTRKQLTPSSLYIQPNHTQTDRQIPLSFSLSLSPSLSLLFLWISDQNQCRQTDGERVWSHVLSFFFLCFASVVCASRSSSSCSVALSTLPCCLSDFSRTDGGGFFFASASTEAAAIAASVVLEIGASENIKLSKP